MRTAGVCGTGTIGSAIAALLIGNGVRTIVVGRSASGMTRCRKTIEENLHALKAARKLTQEQIDTILTYLVITDRYEAAAEAEFVFEAAAESLEVKASVYGRIERSCREDAVIASTTSALPPHVLSEKLMHPQRLVVAHPFQPAHILPLFELVGSERTDPASLKKTKDFLQDSLNRVVVCLHKEIEGFVVNRVAQAMFRECIDLVERGVASPEEIDKAIHYAVGMRYASIGLMEYFDAVGFDLEAEIASTIYPTLCSTTSIQRLVADGISSGKTGMSAGEGLYAWTAQKKDDFDDRKARPYLDMFHWNIPTESARGDGFV